MNIVERIKNLCDNKNTSIKALEREIEISNGSIRHWNEKSPAVERVLRVANYFNVSVEWLLTGKESNELSDEETKLLELFRSSNNIGKKYTLEDAARNQERFPAVSEMIDMG